MTLAAAQPAENEELLRFLGADARLCSPSQQRWQVRARDVLANKVVLLYFTSSWCGPCKRFTPQLMELYRSLKGSNKQDADFEIVLCSMDTMELEYESYAAKMPWWCFPFGAPVVRRLATLYQTSGIPHLVILDACGRKVLHHDGVPKVQADPAGLRFPWRPARLVDLLPAQFTVDLLPAQFTHTNTSLVGPDTEHGPDANSTPLQNVVPFDDQYLLIYASASWCAPCQRLTPKVAAAYRKLRAVRRDVEFLYLSSDRTEEDFVQFHRTMGFPAIPYHTNTAEIAALLQIRSVPTLMMFGPRPPNGCDRPLLNPNVRDIFEQGCADVVAEFPFSPRAYGDLNQVSENINSTRCVVVLAEACDDEEQEHVRETLRIASTLYEGCDTTRFYWACAATQLTKTLRDTLQLEALVDDDPLMILLDIPTGASYYVSATADVSVESVLHFVRQPGTCYKL